ncbi:hypothetical protein [Rhizobium sp. SGZ-381]|uniref:hypothetical protein n=1 Tax=Rhizobium sp. SGZ-381 TaxID=3342800 RepID=UPI00366C267C
MAANRLYNACLLLVSLAFFATLALDIAVPALVLTLMAAIRWALVIAENLAPHDFPMKGQAA